MSTGTWNLHDADHTRAAGRALANGLSQLNPAEALVITLSGELGAGKTTLVSGLLAALGVTGPVRSPTYTLIEPYELPAFQVYHLDLYRLTDPLQLEDLGLRDLLQPGAVLLVEWAERGGDFFANPNLVIQLSYPENGSEGRQLTLTTQCDLLASLVDSLSF